MIIGVVHKDRELTISRLWSFNLTERIVMILRYLLYWNFWDAWKCQACYKKRLCHFLMRHFHHLSTAIP